MIHAYSIYGGVHHYNNNVANKQQSTGNTSISSTVVTENVGNIN